MGGGGEPPPTAGRGTFVAFTGHAEGSRARKVLMAAFSPASVSTVANSRRHGACFLVHAHVDDVDAFLNSSVGGSSGSADSLLEGFIAFPPNLKLSPSLLDHGSLDETRLSRAPPSGEGDAGAGGDDGSSATAAATGNSDRGARTNLAAAANAATGAATAAAARARDPLAAEDPSSDSAGPRTTTPGRALHRDGLVVLLSPGSVRRSDRDHGRAVADRWRREWSSDELDLHALSFWSDPGRARVGREGGSTEALLAREWGGAARAVHSLAERRGGVSPAEACGWGGVRVAMEGPDLMAVRGELSVRFLWVLAGSLGRFFLFCGSFA